MTDSRHPLGDRFLLCTALFAFACADNEPASKPTAPDGTTATTDDSDDDVEVDVDNDGHDASTDCNDDDPSIYPGAEDVWYDGIDSDCAENDDYDADADGYQSDAHGGDDCDDADSTTHPDAIDTWYDDVDSDCAGNDDFDADADGHQKLNTRGPDCDDNDPLVHPGAFDDWYDGVDSDCAGNSDYDADGDRFDSSLHGGVDCDDTAGNVNPRSSEVCNDGIDQDCDGLLDCEDADCIVDAACVEDCSNGFDDDGNGLADCDDAGCVGAPDCPAYNLTIDGGRFRRWSKAWAWGVDNYFYAMSLSGSIVARTSSGGTTRCTFSNLDITWVWSPAAYRSGVFDGSPVGDCGGPLDVLFPEVLYFARNGYGGRFDFETPWWSHPTRGVYPHHTPFFTHQSFIRSYDSLTMSGTQHRGAGSHSFYLLGESHAFGYW